ncbi:MAG: hypothetical protein KY429_10650 [Actinobacteria bacterium]|nr:hypothetical protein [Actinomycetota bacterium]
MSTNWLVTADASAACKPRPTWGPFISSYRIHASSLSNKPTFEASHLYGDTGINRAELRAIVHALHMLVLAWETDNYSRGPVTVYTDSQVAFNFATGAWQPRELASMVDELFNLHDRLGELSGERVWYVKANEATIRSTDQLGRKFRDICDSKHVEAWNRENREAREARRIKRR